MTITNEQKTIWLVGASSGIGKELALQLADQGHKVVISARRAAELEKIAAENPSRIFSMALDVTDHSHKFLHISMLASLTDHIDIGK